MKRNNIKLNILDNYARILTQRQTEKLYEAKCNKTHTKKLLKESSAEESKFRVFFPKSVMAEAGQNINRVISYLQYGEISNGDDQVEDFFYTPTEQGFWAYTIFKDSYEVVLGRAAELGLSDGIAEYVRPKECVDYLYLAQ